MTTPSASARLTAPPGVARAVRPSAAGATVRHRLPSRAWRWGSLAALLTATSVLYIAGLSKSGYANSFYSAAAQAGSKSWKAWFFGSLDAANAITVDKPPAALWIMGLFVRLFGLSSWSILVPEAIMGVLSVWLTYALARRILLNRGAGSPTHAHAGGLIAGATLALTPAAALMFRFNNPDALLVLLTIAAAYATVRALEDGRTRWLVAAGVAIGFGFLTKMLQAFLILPVLAAVYAAFAPVGWAKRLRQLVAAAASVVVSAGWYVAVVELVPTSWRPYIGGSQNNSILELIIGYNGLGRITGNETGSVTGGQPGAAQAGTTQAGTAQAAQAATDGAAATPSGGAGGAAGGMWGHTGITRLFDGVSGGMIAWLIPAALIVSIVALVVRGRRRRTDLVRAGLVLGLGWLVITAGVFSFMAGIYHDYYTVALAPAIALTLALGAAVLWRERDVFVARLGLAAAAFVTAGWSIALASRAQGIYVLVAAVAAAVLVLCGIGALVAGRLGRGVSTAMAALAVVAALAAPASYAVQTASVGHQGSIVTAGPVAGQGGPGGAPGQGGRGQAGPGQGAPGQSGAGQNGTGQNGANGAQAPGGMTGQGAANGTGQGTANGITQGGSQAPGQPPAGMGQGPNAPAGAASSGTGAQATDGSGVQAPGGATSGTGQAGAPAGASDGAQGGPRGMLEGMNVSSALTQALQSDADHYTWVAASVGSQTAASLQLASGDPVMAIGGFNGSDPSPTLEQFQAYVAAGKIHYFVAGGMGGQQNGGSNAAAQISTWVKAHYTAVTIGGQTLYDLTQPLGE